MSALPSLDERLWSKISRGEDDVCWPWTGCVKNGRGVLNVDGASLPVHQLVYQRARGLSTLQRDVTQTCGLLTCCNPAHIARKPKVVARFWAKVRKGAPEVCWPWTAGLFENGYGAFSMHGKTTHAHRVAYQLARGKDHLDDAPPEVTHTCSCKTCCNPAHLIEKLTGEAGRVEQARLRALLPPAPPPEPKCPNPRLVTERDRAIILSLVARGFSSLDVSVLTPFHKSTVNRVCRKARETGWDDEEDLRDEAC